MVHLSAAAQWLGNVALGYFSNTLPFSLEVFKLRSRNTFADDGSSRVETLIHPGIRNSLCHTGIVLYGIALRNNT